MKLLNVQEMQKLTTARLMQYRKSMLKCRETYNEDGCNLSETVKQSHEWQENYAQLKEILKTREHWE